MGTSVISSKNCRGAVESVLLQTLRPNEYRPAKSGEKQTQISLYSSTYNRYLVPALAAAPRRHFAFPTSDLIQGRRLHEGFHESFQSARKHKRKHGSIRGSALDAKASRKRESIRSINKKGCSAKSGSGIMILHKSETALCHTAVSHMMQQPRLRSNRF